MFMKHYTAVEASSGVMTSESCVFDPYSGKVWSDVFTPVGDDGVSAFGYDLDLCQLMRTRRRCRYRDRHPLQLRSEVEVAPNVVSIVVFWDAP